ncbi:hypothetical protein CJ030_MR4G015441 [Morella rubra]|uniref:Mitochondrial import inner membrane translocase subunit TIM50 n=1 Tax=Morella rubra TaxID=262757 RepID=A0A6A1VY72_9ROSI|nr:hypothetical protein CJ030_MR4G015441 [Morella rubra]
MGSGIPQSNSVSKKRRTENDRHASLESNGKDCGPPEATSLLNVTLPQIDQSLQPPVKSGLQLEREMADVKHKSVILGEQIGFPESGSTSLTEECDDDVGHKYASLDQKNLKMYSQRKWGKINSKESGESYSSFGDSLKSIKGDRRDPLCSCSDDVPTSGSQDNKFDRAILAKHSTSMQFMESKAMEQASSNFVDGERASQDCKEGTKMKYLEKNYCELSFANDAIVPEVPKEQLEQKNGTTYHTIQTTGWNRLHVEEDFCEPASYGEGITTNKLFGFDPSCKHLEQMDIEMETKIEGNPSHMDFVKDDTDSGVVIKEHKFSQIWNSPPERLLLDSSNKKLLILDVNGLLADIVSYVPPGSKADIVISGKAVFRRPFCDDFLQFCFDKFVVGVWSSRTKRNMDRLIDFLMGDSRCKLLFCWDQSHCTSTGVNTLENKEKPLLLKELRKLWEKLEPDLPWEKGEYREANTLLLDDSPYKALLNPVNTAIFPHTYQYTDFDDTSLGPGGGLRVYVEGLAMADNVQKYVQENPFGQLAISESNPSWSFYRQIIDTHIPSSI